MVIPETCRVHYIYIRSTLLYNQAEINICATFCFLFSEKLKKKLKKILNQENMHYKIDKFFANMNYEKYQTVERNSKMLFVSPVTLSYLKH